MNGELNRDSAGDRASEPAAARQEQSRFAKREDRRLVEMRGYIVRADDEIVDIRVLDLSYDGCRIETVVPLADGEVVKLSVLGRGAITATVRWYSARRAGLLFSSKDEAATRALERAARAPVGADALLRRSGKAGYRVRASDLSPNGCKCEFVDRPDIHEHVWLKFAGLESLEAKVCWVSGFDVGLKFCNPIHSAVFDLLIQRLSCSSASSA
jgi:hypothetical protein